MPSFRDIIYADFLGGQRLDRQALSLGPAELLKARDVIYDEVRGVHQRGHWQSFIHDAAKNEVVNSIAAYFDNSTGATIETRFVFSTDVALYNFAAAGAFQANAFQTDAFQQSGIALVQIEATSGPFAFVNWRNLLYNLHLTRSVGLRKWNGTTNADVTAAPKGSCLAVHDDRLWIGGIPTNLRAVRFATNLGDDSVWGATSAFTMPESAGGRVNGLVSIRTGALLIFMTTGVFKITGSPVSSPTLERISSHGMVVEDAWAQMEEGVFYLSHDGVRFTDGELSILVARSLTRDPLWQAVPFDRGKTSMAWLAQHNLLLLCENSSGGQRVWVWSRVVDVSDSPAFSRQGGSGESRGLTAQGFALAEAEWATGASTSVRKLVSAVEPSGEELYAGLRAVVSGLNVLRYSIAPAAQDAHGAGLFAAGTSSVRFRHEVLGNPLTWKTPVSAWIGGSFPAPTTFTHAVYFDGEGSPSLSQQTLLALLSGTGAASTRKASFLGTNLPRGRAVSLELSWPHSANPNQLDLVVLRVREHDERAPE